jgi:hypothetical protein
LFVIDATFRYNNRYVRFRAISELVFSGTMSRWP